MGLQWHQLDHMQIICTSLQTDNHASTVPLYTQFLQDGCPSCHPTNSIKALKPKYVRRYRQWTSVFLGWVLIIHAMIDVNGSSLPADSETKLVGLVWGLMVTWRQVCIHQWTFTMACHDDSTVNFIVGIIIIVPSSCCCVLWVVVTDTVHWHLHRHCKYCMLVVHVVDVNFAKGSHFWLCVTNVSSGVNFSCNDLYIMCEI